MSIATIVIIAANVIASIKGFNDFTFFEKYKFNIGAIKRGEQIRNITSGFLHVDFTHLIFNMITLYFFAPIVVGFFGDPKFLIIYFVSLLFGSLLSLGIHKDEYHYSAVGASGAVTGILYSAILLNPDMRLAFFFVPIPIPAFIFGIGYLLYSIYGMKNRIGNIGHTAHFGGAIGGYVMTLFLRPSLISQEPLMVVLLAIPIVILFAMEKFGKI
ncbi:rhomboid family intramembrane serine protease [Robertkochia solimangrovi]|uniref:rhomboid family intramembrane serine protease n=1 Tax=Robertkochia solimangrovi TaxID=2213046 RepID=UPI001F553A4A|nr:rhomboid family intramembrane serine protease [Robertkochia solimangrovi]